MKNGQIVDIYPEGKKTYRACVTEVYASALKVVDLETGCVKRCGKHECSAPIIEDIFQFKDAGGVINAAKYYNSCVELDQEGRPVEDYDRDCAALKLRRAIEEFTK